MPRSAQRFVLVVDDDPFVISIFSKAFEGQPDFLLDVAMTIELALQKIHVALYDIIFLDMKIGHSYAGMDVLRELNRMAILARGEVQQLGPNSLVIIMSASIRLQDVMQEAHDLGVVCFIDKPVPFTEDFVRKIVNRVGLPLLPHRQDGRIGS